MQFNLSIQRAMRERKVLSLIQFPFGGIRSLLIAAISAGR